MLCETGSPRQLDLRAGAPLVADDGPMTGALGEFEAAYLAEAHSHQFAYRIGSRELI